MEEILASIKRIIADDGAAAVGTARSRARPVVVPPPEPPQAEPETVLRDTGDAEEASVEPVPAEAESTDDSADEAQAEILELTEPVPFAPRPAVSEPEAEDSIETPVAAAPEPSRPTPVPNAAGIVSDDAAFASRQALAALSALVVRPEQGADNTLEGLVRDMLKPMLKEWLDAQLPELVESMVAREIARITGKIA
jgi:uncharacterized protein